MRILTWRDCWHGMLVYSIGDSAAAWISGEFMWTRLIGMALLGGTLYALEIPAYFRWIDRRFTGVGRGVQIKRMMVAQAFFNPFWIARHIVFINSFSGQFEQISWGLIAVGGASFINILPVALTANYWIQNKISYRWRFFANAVFSAVMAVYYALSETWFA